MEKYKKPVAVLGGDTMDAELVEKITRLVLSKLEEYAGPSQSYGSNTSPHEENKSPEYPPLSDYDFKKWKEISSAIGFSKEGTHLAPLSEEEINIWKNISASIGFNRRPQADAGGHSDYPPLTKEELSSWKRLGNKTASWEEGQGQVKFFPHHD